jgi:hypothetical protein
MIKTLIALLLINSVALADTVIVIPDNRSQGGVLSRAEQMNSMIQNHNWNVERNAAVNDAIRYEQLRPVPKLQIEAIQPQPAYNFKLPEVSVKPKESGQYQIIE